MLEGTPPPRSPFSQCSRCCFATGETEARGGGGARQRLLLLRGPTWPLRAPPPACLSFSAVVASPSAGTSKFSPQDPSHRGLPPHQHPAPPTPKAPKGAHLPHGGPDPRVPKTPAPMGPHSVGAPSPRAHFGSPLPPAMVPCPGCSGERGLGERGLGGAHRAKNHCRRGKQGAQAMGDPRVLGRAGASPPCCSSLPDPLLACRGAAGAEYFPG